MNFEKKVIQYINKLPEHEKAEGLDSIDSLKTKGERKALKEWADFSIFSAMQDMEAEDILYSLDDLKESFS